MAAVAIGAISAQAAAALPEVGRCVAQAGTGKYKDAGCREKAGALTSEKAFEWKRNPLNGKFAAVGGKAVIETAEGVVLECGSESATGEYLTTTSTKAVKNVVMVLEDCQVPLLGGACHSPGAEAGRIVSNKLKGKLAYISGKGTKTPVVGQLLAPEGTGVFREWECFGGATRIREAAGAGKGHATAIAEVATLNTMSATLSETYKGAKGVQESQHIEGSTALYNLEASLNGGTAQLADQAFATTITNEEALEIKA
ncbi:MAG TPA: hypothetical protein VN772_02265 [Solirubrobacteraceae bacterium]|nr:hypothetical protein [Solirubrobacteraceae bacterium]